MTTVRQVPHSLLPIGAQQCILQHILKFPNTLYHVHPSIAIPINTAIPSSYDPQLYHNTIVVFLTISRPSVVTHIPRPDRVGLSTDTPSPDHVHVAVTMLCSGMWIFHLLKRKSVITITPCTRTMRQDQESGQQRRHHMGRDCPPTLSSCCQ